MRKLVYFVGYLLLANNPVLAWKLAKVKVNAQKFRSLYEDTVNTKVSHMDEVDELVHNNRNHDYKVKTLEFIDTNELSVKEFDTHDIFIMPTENDITIYKPLT